MRTHRATSLLIEDIIKSVTRIKEYSSGLDFDTFSSDYKTLDAIARNFSIINEASKNIPKEFKDKNSSIEWKRIAGLKDQIMMDYIRVDANIVYTVINEYLNKLISDISKIEY